MSMAAVRLNSSAAPCLAGKQKSCCAAFAGPRLRRRVQIFKPHIDARYGLQRVASHNGVAREDVVVVATAAAILECPTELRPT